MPYKEDDSFAASYEKIVNNKPICYCDSVNKKKFVGGTPAVQSSDVREVFIKKDKYESLVLPHKKQIFDISDEVLVSTLKKAENSDDLILRVYNPWEEEKEISLEGYDVSETDFLEKSMKNFSGIVEKKKINTYKIKGKYDE